MYNPQINTFIHVANVGSFSKAAEELYITPTAVIKQINSLEARLGFPLFVRSRHGLALTSAGRSLLKDARHIVRYSQDSLVRAKNALQSKQCVIRIGVSLMTPTNTLTTLWPQITEHCSNIALQLVTFENNAYQAQEILRNLGKDVDVVLGIYDEAYLGSRKINATLLFHEPLLCAVPNEWSLGKKPSLTLEDLHGHKLMIIAPGWNCEMDKARAYLQQNHPAIELVEFPQYCAEAFNQAAHENAAILSISQWKDVHPMLNTLPVNWDFSVSYGLFHTPTPDDHLLEFLNAIREVAGQ